MKSSARSEEAVRRVDLVSKLFVQFASSKDTREAIEVYLVDTADIPQAWLEPALRSFRDDAGREFVPSVAEIRTRVAETFLDTIRRARSSGSNPGAPKTGIAVEATLERLRREAPHGPAELARLEAENSNENSNSNRGENPHESEPVEKRGEGAAESLAAILDRVRVVDEDGKVMPVAALGDRIWKEGVFVPGDRSMRSRWLTTLVATKSLGRPTTYHRLTKRDWELADAEMYKHRTVTGSDTAWWFDEPWGERGLSWRWGHHEKGGRRWPNGGWN